MTKSICRIALMFLVFFAVKEGRAQVLTFDLQGFLQTLALKAVGEDQLTTLGNMLQVSTDNLATAKKINDLLGSPDKSQLERLNLKDVESLLHSIPGLESVDIAKLFPPDVAGAFLGKSFREWKTLIADPTAIIADQLRRISSGDLLPQSTENDRLFVQSLLSTPPRGKTRSDTATNISRFLASKLLESVGTQGQQTAAYAATKSRFSEESQKNLTLIDRAKLNNDQSILGLELQLQQLQAQSIAHSVQAMQSDAQTRLLEQQLQREEADRSARTP